MDFLTENHFKMEYRPGMDNGAAEFLSRTVDDTGLVLCDEGDLVGVVGISDAK